MRCRFGCLAVFLCGLLTGCGTSGPAFTSATTFTTSATYAVAGSSPAITLTATVKGIVPTGKTATAAPTGAIGFLAGGTQVGAVTLNGSSPVSVSIDPAKFPLGQDSVTAVYAGDGNYAGSTSAPVSIQVQTNTSLALGASPDSVQQGSTGYLIATVARTAGSGAPTGNVSFSQGGTTLGTAALDNTGTAAYPLITAQLPLAAYPVSATYSGDAADLASNTGSATVTITPAVDVLTQRNNSARTGVQPAETILTPANVNATTFGKVFTFQIDGYAYAQPLYVSNYTMNDGKSHNVLFVESSAGSVYAFDADNNNPPAGYLWHISAIPAGEQVVGPNDVGCQDTQPNTTIIGTPVIDRTRGVMYLVSKTKTSNTSAPFVQRIHALNLADGTEKLNGPTVITASVPGTGDGSVNGTVTFNPLTQNQRAALVEASGSVWITWASHCDNPNYHGWTIGYNANDVSQQTAYYNNTPDGSDGGIWMTGGGISTDNLGNLYTAAGNGTFDANTGGRDYGDSVQRLAIGPNSLTPADWFVPSNQLTLENDDLDFGTVAPILFDDPGSAVAPHLLATSDKTGRVYLINRDDMGNYDTGKNGANSLNGDLQDFAANGTMFNNYGYFNQRLYVGAGNSVLVAYDFTPGTTNSAGYLDSTPSMSTTQVFSGMYSTGGTQPIFSANGTSNAILWGEGTVNSATTLYALDPDDLSNMLYSSATNPTRDQPPAPVKFAHPIVANGRVYVAGQGSVAVYGLLP